MSHNPKCNERNTHTGIFCTWCWAEQDTEGQTAHKLNCPILYTPEPTPPRDAYDLAEIITAKVQAGTWTEQAVADAIEKLYEAREAAKALETRP